ncbi:general transcription factor II-I repeat domain-containing protein 2-like [Lepeophtheirus salmonis]|uniref:general transcription factor II-I repeat domain-containing protein 2-like n=1 Tax=Lepeophtheirus salmonis TaxID=72036 RepID=UPI003AF38F80
MMKASELIFPKKRQTFNNISLTRNMIAESILELSEDLTSQLKQKVGGFIAFSVAIDKSTDITDVAKSAIFIKDVYNTLTVTQEFVELVPIGVIMGTTTAEDIFVAVVAALDRVGVDWSRAVSITADGAPSMIGKRDGVMTKFKAKVQVHNRGDRF